MPNWKKTLENLREKLTQASATLKKSGSLLWRHTSQTSARIWTKLRTEQTFKNLPGKLKDGWKKFRQNPDNPESGEKLPLKQAFQRFAAGSKVRIQALIKEKRLAEKFQNFEPREAAEWLTKTFQKQNAGVYGKALTIILSTWFLADLTSLSIERFIPEPPAPRPVRGSSNQRRTKSIDEYNLIFTRNLFNSRGLIPGEDTGPVEQDSGGAPIKSTLPLNLIGTMVLRDELRSVATIEDKGSSLVYPVVAGDEIPSKIRVIKVEARRVIFINTSNGHREYIDLPEDVAIQSSKVSVTKGAGISQLSPTAYNISRAEVDKDMSDMNTILTQARAVPNFENGVTNGYKLFQIVPGSIYEKLGLQNGDVIQGVNGEAINDPGKAFELLSQLKTSNHLDIQIMRGGKPMPFSYDIH